MRDSEVGGTNVDDATVERRAGIAQGARGHAASNRTAAIYDHRDDTCLGHRSRAGNTANACADDECFAHECGISGSQSLRNAVMRSASSVSLIDAAARCRERKQRRNPWLGSCDHGTGP